MNSPEPAKRCAVVTGITGQDGAYLAELLLSKGYRVYGAYRRTGSVNIWRIEELGIQSGADPQLVEFDLTNLASSIGLMHKAQPDEVYDLAAQSFVGASFNLPATIAQITGVVALNLPEVIRLTNPEIPYYQASTSEIFGKVQTVSQAEDVPFYPRSLYSAARLYAHWMTVNYGKSTASSVAAASCSTTKVRCADANSLRAKSRTSRPRSSSDGHRKQHLNNCAR